MRVIRSGSGGGVQLVEVAGRPSRRPSRAKPSIGQVVEGFEAAGGMAQR